jgi:hypothetical protein
MNISYCFDWRGHLRYWLQIYTISVFVFSTNVLGRHKQYFNPQYTLSSICQTLIKKRCGRISYTVLIGEATSAIGYRYRPSLFSFVLQMFWEGATTFKSSIYKSLPYIDKKEPWKKVRYCFDLWGHLRYWPRPSLISFVLQMFREGVNNISILNMQVSAKHW